MLTDLSSEGTEARRLCSRQSLRGLSQLVRALQYDAVPSTVLNDLTTLPDINQNHIISMPPSPHSAEDLQRIKQEFEWGTTASIDLISADIVAGEPGQELPSSLDPGTVLELLRQWVVTIDSIVPITFSECLMLACVSHPTPTPYRHPHHPHPHPHVHPYAYTRAHTHCLSACA